MTHWTYSWSLWMAAADCCPGIIMVSGGGAAITPITESGIGGGSGGNEAL